MVTLGVPEGSTPGRRSIGQFVRYHEPCIDDHHPSEGGFERIATFCVNGATAQSIHDGSHRVLETLHQIGGIEIVA